MKVLHDFLLVKEIIKKETIEGTNLELNHDDMDSFMYVEIIETSRDLPLELTKYYPQLPLNEAILITNKIYKKGNHLLVNKLAKKPYRDGMYFISFKDVFGIDGMTDLTIEQEYKDQLEHTDILIRG